MRQYRHMIVALLMVVAGVVSSHPTPLAAQTTVTVASAVESVGSIANGVSDEGLIVGYSKIWPAGEHAVLWQGPNQIVDLGGVNGAFRSFYVERAKSNNPCPRREGARAWASKPTAATPADTDPSVGSSG